MASKIITKGLKRTALSVALGMCFAGSALAQSNSTGNISGTTTAGATVVIENPATGFNREITADSSGNYNLRNLPLGSYKELEDKKPPRISGWHGATVAGRLIKKARKRAEQEAE